MIRLPTDIQHVTPFVECTSFADADGALVLKIVHGEPTIAIPAILPTGRVVYRLQREQGDIIRYSPKGILSISCSKAPLLRHYVPLCGRVFFQDATFFPQVPSIFLNVLLDEAAIQDAARCVGSIRRAALTKVTVWDDGGFVLAMSHKANVHPAVRRSRLESTQVKRAEITLWLHEPGNPKDVAYTIRLEPPFKRQMDEHSVHQPAAQEFLEELGIFEKPKFQDRAAGNWLAFQPWSMPEPEWQRLNTGKDVQPLIDGGVLTRVRLDHLIEPTVAAGPIPIVTARTGEQIAVPADPFAVPLRVSPTQIFGLEWNPRAQAQVIATALGTTGGIGDLVFDSVMDLGSRDLGNGHSYHAYLFLSNPSDAELESLRQRAGGPTLGFLPSGVPRRRLFDTVPIRLPALDFPGLHQLALRATRLEHHVTALETAHPEDQFAIDFQTERIWWVPTRQELDLEVLPEQARDHFLCIARRSWREGGTHLDVSSPVPHLTIRTDTHRDPHVGQEAFVRAMTRISFTKPLCLASHLTGRELFCQLGLSQDEELVLHHHGHERPIHDDETCELAQGDHLTCRPRHRSVTVHLNHHPVTFDNPRQTGLSIKEKAGISPSDALFLDVACGPDVVIPNDAEICLQDGSCLFTQPGADYGSPAQAALAKEVFPTGTILQPQPDGWTFVILKDQQLPEVFSPDRTDMAVSIGHVTWRSMSRGAKAATSVFT